MEKAKGLGKILLENYLGKPIAILCMRYWYRGIVKSVDDDVVTLINPRAVEVTGASSLAAPQTEDPIPSDLHINLGAVEIMMQPTWCFHTYETDKKTGKWISPADAKQK
jgi:hypothetical protein